MSEDFDMVALKPSPTNTWAVTPPWPAPEHTAAEIDRLVVAMVKKNTPRPATSLRSNIGKLHELAKFLYEKKPSRG